MFIRYTLVASSEEVGQRFAADVPESYQPHYNAAPTHLLPVITQDSQQGLSFLYWGAPPSLANKKLLGEKIINTRVELIPERPVLRKKMREKRCLVLADGFYLWKRTGKKAHIPYRFTLKDKSPFSIAGLWEEYDDDEGNMFHTFTIITLEAAEGIASGERMPVILNPTTERTWLDTHSEDSLLSILQTATPTLDYYSVSSLVNFPDRNDRTIILPAPPADQFGNLSLFD